MLDIHDGDEEHSNENSNENYNENENDYNFDKIIPKSKRMK